MSRFTVLALAASAVLFLTDPAASQSQLFPLESAEGLELQNVTAEPATLQGKKGLRITASEEALRRLKENAPEAGPATAQLARIEGIEFSNGTIEAEIAGAPAPGSPGGARGFVGIGFRLQDDNRTYDEFYLRPTNGRAEDQERRNHSVQYVQHPDWPWFRLRKETPSTYEAYVDLVPGQWTKVKIEVSGERARLYVHDSEQPTLIVNDVKSGANAKGGVALCIGPGTVAHFRNLTVSGQAGDTASSR